MKIEIYKYLLFLSLRMTKELCRVIENLDFNVYVIDVKN